MRKFCGKGIFREIWKNRYVVLKGDQLYISEKEVGSVSFSSPFPPLLPFAHKKRREPRAPSPPQPPGAGTGPPLTKPLHVLVLAVPENGEIQGVHQQLEACPCSRLGPGACCGIYVRFNGMRLAAGPWLSSHSCPPLSFVSINLSGRDPPGKSSPPSESSLKTHREG